MKSFNADAPCEYTVNTYRRMNKTKGEENHKKRKQKNNKTTKIEAEK